MLARPFCVGEKRASAPPCDACAQILIVELPTQIDGPSHGCFVIIAKTDINRREGTFRVDETSAEVTTCRACA